MGRITIYTITVTAAYAAHKGGEYMEEQTKHEAPKTAPKPPKNPEPPVSGPLAQLEAWLYDMLVHKAPFQLPKSATDWIVQYGPWIALVGGILAAIVIIPTTLTALSLTSYTTAMYGVYAASVAAFAPMLYLALVVLALQLVILFISIPMLLKRQRKGWLLVFYTNLVSLVYTLVSSFTYGFNFGTLLGGLIGAAIGFYVIFQIRSYYKS